LAVLKYYKVKKKEHEDFIYNQMLCVFKVEDTGKIHRLRRECPSKQCGAGVFMASHHDRNYCGKCCVTYMFKKREEEE
jgi:small subunit ribosomal protein S27Ae